MAILVRIVSPPSFSWPPRESRFSLRTTSLDSRLLARMTEGMEGKTGLDSRLRRE